MDSERRAYEVRSWYLKPLLDSLTQIVRTIPADRTMNHGDALARIYPLLGAMSSFIVSDVVLQQMYGSATYARVQRGYPDEIRKQVRGLAEALA